MLQYKDIIGDYLGLFFLNININKHHQIILLKLPTQAQNIPTHFFNIGW